MTEEEAAEIRALRDRLEYVESLARHQAGIVAALYNGLDKLGTLMLTISQTTSQVTLNALARREPPHEELGKLKIEMDAFAAELKDIHHRLRLMNERPS